MPKMIEQQGLALERATQILAVHSHECLFYRDRRVLKSEIDCKVHGAHSTLPKQADDAIAISKQCVLGQMHGDGIPFERKRFIPDGPFPFHTLAFDGPRGQEASEARRDAEVEG